MVLFYVFAPFLFNFSENTWTYFKRLSVCKQCRSRSTRCAVEAYASSAFDYSTLFRGGLSRYAQVSVENALLFSSCHSSLHFCKGDGVTIRLKKYVMQRVMGILCFNIEGIQFNLIITRLAIVRVSI